MIEDRDWLQKIEYMFSSDLADLVDRMNKFYSVQNAIGNRIIATTLVSPFEGEENYQALIYIKIKPINSFKKEETKPRFTPMEKKDPATSSQIWRLKHEGVPIPEGLTKKEANIMIKNLKGGQNADN